MPGSPATRRRRRRCGSATRAARSMENVHGISVAGGTFPAEIWRRFMERAVATMPVREFPEPRQPPVWQFFHRGPLALSYDPYAPVATEETTETTPAATPASSGKGKNGRASASVERAPRRLRQAPPCWCLCARSRRSPGSRCAVRPQPRRHRGRLCDVGAGVAGGGVRRLRRRRGADRAGRRRPVPPCGDPGGRDSARAVAGAATRLHGCLDILGLRLDRRRRRRQPLRRAAE